MQNETHEVLDTARVRNAKRSFTTRRVAPSEMTHLKTLNWSPKPGDLLLARVEKLGHHARIELPEGRRAHMFPGDEIIVVCGSRYAPDQFEAVLDGTRWPTDLVAAGGVASINQTKHSSARTPTQLAPLGAVCNAKGKPLNVADYALKPIKERLPISTILVAGTNMNAGKTSSAAAIIRGLVKKGHRVGAAKITGTGAGPDPWLMSDSGAHVVLDFTDAGYVSTFNVPLDELEEMAHNLINHLAFDGCDVAVLEVADGLLQPETAGLLSSSAFRLRISAALFTAYDAMGAVTGVEWLRSKAYRLLGVSGRLSASALASREAEAATGLTVFTLADLSDGTTLALTLSDLQALSRAS